MENFFRRITNGDFLPQRVSSFTYFMPARFLGYGVRVQPGPVLRRSERIRAMMEKKRLEEELKKTGETMEQKPKPKKLSRRSPKTQKCDCCAVDLVLTCPHCNATEDQLPPRRNSGAGYKRKRNDAERESKRRNLGVSSPKPPRPLAQPNKKAKKATPAKRSH